MSELEKQESAYDMQSFNYNLAEYLMKRVKPFCKDRILDLGCGIGVFTKLLADAGFEVVGLDGSKKKIETAQKNVPKATFKVSMFEDFKPEKPFDAVMAKNILEHLTEEQSKTLFKNVYSWLKPDGRFIAYVPNALALHRRIGFYMGISKSYSEESADGLAVGHVQAWTRQKLELELNIAGFNVIECKGLVLKPFPNRMMQLISEKLCDALFQVANDPRLADLCSGIYTVSEKMVN